MIFLRKIFFIAAGLSAFLFSGCFDGSKKSPVLANFDGSVLTEAEFGRRLDALPKQLRGMALGRKKEFVEDIIAEHYLVKEAEKQHLADIPDVRDVLKEARKKIIISKLIEKEVDQKIKLGPGEAERYYQTHKEEFMTHLILRASHILVRSEEEAKAIRAQLLAGADFEETARAKSVDTTAARGGDLGFFQKGQFIPEFEEAVFKMKKGETSGIVQSQFGYHIIKLTDRMEPALRDYRSVEELVKRKVWNEKRAKAFEEYIAKIKGNAKVKIDEKALEAFPSSPTQGVK